ncbi:hypothetical protein [Streptomonospora litoralis]|uniref:Uncharacterized protein n=1 Tax=Streptomonospora litoralis TaxID=2498135 RepID=A0A4P6QAR5_9ACTN|nr:hypothetical protein [Streptomonospora litoralis]QBI56861.1 hypothetical protein EKD16_25605 [Streptomonospora litoralis]
MTDIGDRYDEDVCIALSRFYESPPGHIEVSEADLGPALRPLLARILGEERERCAAALDEYARRSPDRWLGVLHDGARLIRALDDPPTSTDKSDAALAEQPTRLPHMDTCDTAQCGCEYDTGFLQERHDCHCPATLTDLADDDERVVTAKAARVDAEGRERMLRTALEVEHGTTWPEMLRRVRQLRGIARAAVRLQVRGPGGTYTAEIRGVAGWWVRRAVLREGVARDPGTVVDDIDAALGRARRLAMAPSDDDSGQTVRVQRACDRCGTNLRDANEAEMDAAVAGRKLPDVSGECPTCTPSADACVNCGATFVNNISFNGAAQYRDTRWCRRCIDRCHEGGADHKCPICTTEETRRG